MARSALSLRGADRLSVSAEGGIRDAELVVAGFKHSFVSVVSACVACRGQLVLRNAPDIAEREVMSALLRATGASVVNRGCEFELDASTVSETSLAGELSSRIHGSMYLVPALAAACGQVELPESGGCAIGNAVSGRRPIEHFLRVVEAFGATATANERAGLNVRAANLSAATIDIMDFSDRSDILNGPLVSGATKAALICAAGVKSGNSVVRNPYGKPDVHDLVRYLQLAGFEVSADATRVRVGAGRRVERVEMDLTPDLGEIITYLTLSILSRRRIRLHAAGMERAIVGLEAELRYLADVGVTVVPGPDSIEVHAPATLQSTDIDVTSVGIYSDHQPFFALLLTRANGVSTIRDFVWTSRFSYATALESFGARFTRIEGGIKVYPSELSRPTASVHAEDLRMAAVLLVAAILVAAPVTLTGMHHLERGYGGISDKLQALGVRCAAIPN